MARGSDNKDMSKLLAEVDSWEGWRVEDTNGGWRVYPPNGATPFTVTHGPRNPWRQRKNVISKIRRAGGPL